jgi:hypothetical protein
LTDESIAYLNDMIRPVQGFLVSMLAALLLAAPAEAVRVSGGSACDVPRSVRGSEVAPALATGPSGLIAAWGQDPDRVSGTPSAIGVAYSSDGGTSWTRVRATGCRRGFSEPSLSIGPDGTAYLATGRALRVSADGGASWSTTPLRRATRVTADPLRPGHAHAIWYEPNVVLLRQTVDGGLTWSPARVIERGQVLDPGSIAVMPSGRLRHVWFKAGRRNEVLVASHSDDLGATWSRPERVAVVDDAPRFGVRSAPIAVPAGGYAAWLDAGRVLVARVGDPPRVALEGSTPFFSSALAAGPDGSIAVTAYRVRSGGRADVVAATSSDGTRWRRERVAKPFALSRAPRSLGGQRYLGAPGLAALPVGFAVAPVIGRNVFYVEAARTRSTRSVSVGRTPVDATGGSSKTRSSARASSAAPSRP